MKSSLKNWKKIHFRRYKYRLCIAKSEEIWERIRIKPSLFVFAEKNYAWFLPQSFDIKKCEEVCKLFIVSFLPNHL